MNIRFQCAECGAYTIAHDRLDANKKLQKICAEWDEPHKPVARDQILIVKQLRFDDFDAENPPVLMHGQPNIKPTGGAA